MLKKIVLAAASFTLFALAQAPAPNAAAGGGRGRGPQAPAVVSPEVLPDHRVTFRLFAPDATKVELRAGDIRQYSEQVDGKAPPPMEFKKGENGVWEGTTAQPIQAGVYRYTLAVNGVAVVDPRNPSISESNNNVWSVFTIPGSDAMDVKTDIAHGSVAAVHYYSTSLKKMRRLHVYTPPGYEANGSTKYPVFYLLHGASDSDDSWTSVGHANFIIDNLIAAKKAKPMIVVMPAGHTSQTFGGGGRGAAGGPAPRDEFFDDFTTDIMPLVETRYRTINDRAHRAIAGLSMGGSQTMNIAFSHLAKFSHVGVLSSGILGGSGSEAWEKAHLADLENSSLKKGLKTLWFSTGVKDGLIANSKSTVELLKKHGFENATFKESEGAHTWLNWRAYLIEFTPMLFQ